MSATLSLGDCSGVMPTPDGLFQRIGVIVVRGRFARDYFEEMNPSEAIRLSRKRRKKNASRVSQPINSATRMVGGCLETTLDKTRRTELVLWCGYNHNWKRHRATRWKRIAVCSSLSD